MPGTVDDGNGILGHIFGSKDVSREVARRASAQSGVGGGILDMLTPMLDANRDGSAIDDVIGMIGKFMGGR